MRAYYAGQWQDSGEPCEVVNPLNGSVIDTVPELPVSAVDRALQAACIGPASPDDGAEEQLGKVWQRVAEAARARRDELARTITDEQGKVLSEARSEVDAAIRLMEMSAAEAARPASEIGPLSREAGIDGRFGFTTRRSRGVVVVITPYTYPLLLPSMLIASPLIAGCSVILKPARATPLSALRLLELLLEAGLPERRIACLTGAGETLGPALCRDERVARIVMMGARRTAASVQREAGLKPMELIWGGSGAVVVCEDADLDLAASAIVQRALENAGQVALATPWVLAERGASDSLIQRLEALVSGLVFGDPSQIATQVGPLIDTIRADEVAAAVQDLHGRGARRHCGGERDGCLFAPTLLCNVPSDGGLLAGREVLGPVVAVTTIEAAEQAAQLLAAHRQPAVSIFSGDIQRAMGLAGMLDAPNVHLNGIPSWRDGLFGEAISAQPVRRHLIRQHVFVPPSHQAGSPPNWIPTMTGTQDIVHHGGRS